MELHISHTVTVWMQMSAEIVGEKKMVVMEISTYNWELK